MSQLIGIIGGSGSGKTTFINRLREKFDDESLCIISQDNYYKPIEMQQLDENGVANFDIPSSIDINRFVNDIIKVKGGETIELDEYTFNNTNTVARKIILKPAPIIIVEGIFVFYNEMLRNLLDLKLYFHTHENLKLIRRIKRDQRERSYPVDDVIYRYEHHAIPCFKKYIEPYIEHADLVINNYTHFEQAFKVISGYMSYSLQINAANSIVNPKV